MIREIPPAGLKALFDLLIPTNLAPMPSFWESYSDAEIHWGLRACLLIWISSQGHRVPREFQLKATIAMMSGKDCLVDVGTGYGKTLCMALPCLLSPKEMSIIFTPLKRLQAVHVLEFEKFGIAAISINEDTPNNPDLWKVRLCKCCLKQLRKTHGFLSENPFGTVHSTFCTAGTIVHDQRTLTSLGTTSSRASLSENGQTCSC